LKVISEYTSEQQSALFQGLGLSTSTFLTTASIAASSSRTFQIPLLYNPITQTKLPLFMFNSIDDERKLRLQIEFTGSNGQIKVSGAGSAAALALQDCYPHVYGPNYMMTLWPKWNHNISPLEFFGVRYQDFRD